MTRRAGGLGLGGSGRPAGAGVGVDICWLGWRKLVRGYPDISRTPPLCSETGRDASDDRRLADHGSSPWLFRKGSIVTAGSFRMPAAVESDSFRGLFVFSSVMTVTSRPFRLSSSAQARM